MDYDTNLSKYQSSYISGVCRVTGPEPNNNSSLEHTTMTSLTLDRISGTFSKRSLQELKGRKIFISLGRIMEKGGEGRGGGRRWEHV